MSELSNAVIRWLDSSSLKKSQSPVGVSELSTAHKESHPKLEILLQFNTNQKLEVAGSGTWSCGKVSKICGDGAQTRIALGWTVILPGLYKIG